MNAVKSANQSRRRAENLMKFVFIAQALRRNKKGRKKFFRGLKIVQNFVEGWRSFQDSEIRSMGFGFDFFVHVRADFNATLSRSISPKLNLNWIQIQMFYRFLPEWSQINSDMLNSIQSLMHYSKIILRYHAKLLQFNIRKWYRFQFQNATFSGIFSFAFCCYRFAIFMHRELKLNVAKQWKIVSINENIGKWYRKDYFSIFNIELFNNKV